VQLKTLANKQWAPMRETQRRIRKALEQNGILPGDSYRVFQYRNGPGTPVTGHSAPETQHPDPTAAKPNEINPFTGEA
jgi:small conductance mechanosensitive channel